MATNDKWTIEIARHKTGRTGRLRRASLLNIVCACVPIAFLYLPLLTYGEMRYRIRSMMPFKLFALMEFASSIGVFVVGGGLLIAGAVFFLSESKKAKDAATSFVAGFFLGFASLVIFLLVIFPYRKR
jgi:hypothetical protein